jgi:hypothetical protein
MTNEDVLQNTLNIVIERLAKQCMSYETEIANLNAQIIILSSQLNTEKVKSEPEN